MCIVLLYPETQDTKELFDETVYERYTRSGTHESLLREWVKPFSFRIDDITVVSAWI